VVEKSEILRFARCRCSGVGKARARECLFGAPQARQAITMILSDAITLASFGLCTKILFGPPSAPRASISAR
jgi:hypothetical protein